MGSASIVFVLLLHGIWMASADTEKAFVMYENQGPVSAASAVTLPSSSRPLSCHSACLRRNSCLSFSLSSSICSLYDTYMGDPASQLQTQASQVFFNLVPKERVSLYTEDTN